MRIPSINRAISVPMKASPSVAIEQLVEWIGPLELEFLPPEEKTKKPYFGARRSGRIFVKQKRSVWYPLSPVWFAVESELVQGAGQEVRLVTGLTSRTVIGIWAGPIGALIAVASFLEGSAWLVPATVLVLAIVGFVLVVNGRFVEGEFRALVRALEGVAVDARME